MKTLLIIGAGEHGLVVKEIAEACGYNERGIAFLDDNAPNAVGKISEANFSALHYDGVIIAIGNNFLRYEIANKLKKCDNLNLVTLVHPTAYISPSATIKEGTVVEPKAVINSNSIIGLCCIISVGAIIDHNAIIGNYSHINAGAVCMARSKVHELTKIDAGQIIK